MTVRTTLSFTDRHHRFLQEQVETGRFATASAGVAAAVETMIQDDEIRRAMVDALAEEIRARAATPAEDYLGEDDSFAAAFGDIGRA